MIVSNIPAALIEAVWNGVSWFLALGDFQHGKYPQALMRLKKMKRGGKYYIATYVQMDLMTALVYHNMRHYKEAINLVESIRNDITSSNRLPFQERQYLMAYAIWLGNLSRQGLEGKASPLSPELQPDKLSKIDLSNIRKHWKLSFPLVIHPAWNVDSSN